jgi:hypothetical protein
MAPPDGKEVLSKPIVREILTQLHQGSHWGVQAMCDLILRVYVGPGIYTLAKLITEGCLTVGKLTKHNLRGKPLGGRNPGLRPFQSVQVYCTELPWVGHLKNLLIIVDHLTNWVEAMPKSSAIANRIVCF